MMNKKEIFKKVGGIITELNEQYEYLSKSPENLNEIELELFSANSNFLSDHIAVLVKLNENSKKASKAQPETTIKSAMTLERGPVRTEDQEQPAQKQEVNIPNWKFELKKDEDETFQSEGKSYDKLVDKPLSEEENRRIDEETQLKPETEKGTTIEMIDVQVHEPILDVPVIKEVVISQRTVAPPIEKVASENPSPTINDLHSKQSNQGTVGSQFSQRQVKDLKSMISLNDKLLFVRDLFNGYSLAYSEAIELLNRFDRMEAAENFLKQNYAQKNKWEDKQPVVDKFYEILKDRFK